MKSKSGFTESVDEELFINPKYMSRYLHPAELEVRSRINFPQKKLEVKNFYFEWIDRSLKVFKLLCV